jgi:hypothetical protein
MTEDNALDEAAAFEQFADEFVEASHQGKDRSADRLRQGWPGSDQPGQVRVSLGALRAGASRYCTGFCSAPRARFP